jgi:chromosome segregation ATPase
MLRAQYDRLQAEREDMRTERDQLRARLTVAKEVASGEVPQTAVRTGAVAAAEGQPDKLADGRVETELEELRVAHRALRAQYIRLQAERKGVRTERDRLRARLATVNEVVSEGTPSVASSSATPPIDQAAGALRQSPTEHTDDARVEEPTAGAAKP